MLISQINDWVIANNRPSGAIAHGPIQRDGFPLEIAARLPNVGISGAAVDGLAFSGSVDAVRVAIQPWKLDRIGFETLSALELSSPLGQAFRVDRATGSIDRTGDGRDRMSLELQGPNWAISGRPPDLSAARLEIVISRLLSDPTPAIVAINAKGFSSSATTEKVDLSLQALWRGPIDLGNPPKLAQWRDSGGAFELRDVVITNGATRLSGGAVITLDAAMRPAPNGTVTLTGVKPLLDRLTALGVTSPRDAAIGQAALSVMAKPGADGQPEVTLPIASRDGWLMVGPLRVTQLRALPFP
jgi:hypothetical protein